MGFTHSPWAIRRAGGSASVGVDGATTIVSPAASAGLDTLTITPGAHTAVVAEKSDLVLGAHTITITGAYATQRFTRFGQPTISAASALTVTTAATVSIAGAPTVAGSAVITNPTALRVGGNVTIAGAAGTQYSAISVPAHTITDSTTTQVTANPSITGIYLGQITVAQSGGAVDVGNVVGAFLVTPTLGADVRAASLRGLLIGGDSTFGVTGAGSSWSILRTAATIVTLSTTTQLTSSPAIANFSLGQLTINQSGGAVTVDSAAAVYIVGSPGAGASVTLTNSYALWAAGKVRLDGGGTSSQVTAEGGVLAMRASTVNGNNASGTIAIGAAVSIGITTYTNNTATLTMTQPASLYIAGIPVASTNVTFTNAALALWVDAGTTRLDGTTYIGAEANTFATLGLTINQGAADNEILALKSSDVAHGMTTLTETDTYGAFLKAAAATGGLAVSGFSAGTRGLAITGLHVTDNATKSTAGNAAVALRAVLKSGTTGTDIAANANILVVQNRDTTRFILDADGDSHQDVGTAWTEFDDQDDVALLDTLNHAIMVDRDPLRRSFGEFLRYNRETLEQARVVTFNPDGHHFVNWSRTSMLLIGAVRQLGQQLTETRARLATTEARLAALPAAN